MRIEYELKYRDYLLFYIMHQLLSVPVQLLYGGFAVLIFFSALGDKSICASAYFAALAYAAMWVVQLLFNAFYLLFGKNRSLLTRHVVEIQDEAFYEETKYGRSYHYWPGLAKVISRPRFVAVYINANAAHIIPDRAFSSSLQRKEFLSALKGKLSA